MGDGSARPTSCARPGPDSPRGVRWSSAGSPRRDLAALRVHASDDGRRHRRGRRPQIRIGDHWLVDFASCNYLGFDLDREIIDVDAGLPRALGHPPELVAAARQPGLYEEIEERLTELLGCEDSLVLPTITHIHMSVIPVLAGAGTIFLDARAHKTIYDGCRSPAARGATSAGSARRPRRARASCCAPSATAPRLVCMDGVNSMTGNAPDLPRVRPGAREYDALLYVDDAHGFGVIGERGPDEPSPYGTRGNSSCATSARRYDEPRAGRRLLEGVLVAAGLHRLPDRAQEPAQGGRAAVPLLRAVAGRVARHRARRTRRQRAPRRRAAGRPAPHDHARARCLRALGVATPNRSGFPIIEIPLARPRRGSTRSAGSCSTAASTSRSPPIRSSRATRSASGSRSPRPTPTPRSTS